MIKVVSQNHLGVVNYVVGTEAEIADLPKDGLVSQGSTAFVIENSSVYMYDEEENVWKTI